LAGFNASLTTLGGQLICEVQGEFRVFSSGAFASSAGVFTFPSDFARRVSLSDHLRLRIDGGRPLEIAVTNVYGFSASGMSEASFLCSGCPWQEDSAAGTMLQLTSAS
jgi:hypothetical protein